MKLAPGLLFVSGCLLPRQEPTTPPLPVVPPDAPVEYRYAHYSAAQALRVDKDSLGFSFNHGMYSSPYLLLGNGQKRWSIFDLAPQVAPQTPLGREIEQLRRGRARNRRVSIIAFGALGVGAALVALGALTLDNSKPLGVVSISLGTVGFFGGGGYWVFARREKQDRPIDAALLKDYNAALAATLRLCVNGMYLVNCDDAVPVAVPPALMR